MEIFSLLHSSLSPCLMHFCLEFPLSSLLPAPLIRPLQHLWQWILFSIKNFHATHTVKGCHTFMHNRSAFAYLFSHQLFIFQENLLLGGGVTTPHIIVFNWSMGRRIATSPRCKVGSSKNDMVLKATSNTKVHFPFCNVPTMYISGRGHF